VAGACIPLKLITVPAVKGITPCIVREVYSRHPNQERNKGSDIAAVRCQFRNLASRDKGYLLAGLPIGPAVRPPHGKTVCPAVPTSRTTFLFECRATFQHNTTLRGTLNPERKPVRV